MLAAIDRNSNGLYDRYRDCLWVLKAPENKRIQVKVLSMDVEESEDCSADYLQVSLNSLLRVRHICGVGGGRDRDKSGCMIF